MIDTWIYLVQTNQTWCCASSACLKPDSLHAAVTHLDPRCPLTTQVALLMGCIRSLTKHIKTFFCQCQYFTEKNISFFMFMFHMTPQSQIRGKKLAFFHRCFLEGLINPLQEQMEEWKRGVNTLDKDHAKGEAKHQMSLLSKSF